MTAWDLLAVLGGIAIIAFIVFAFRQGMRVPPSGKDPHQPGDYT